MPVQQSRQAGRIPGHDSFNLRIIINKINLSFASLKTEVNISIFFKIK
jgi:hypothetical protein